MDRSEDVLSLFLASPGDVAEERLRVAEVVTNWNRAWSRELSLRLELVRWEDDAFPGIDDDAQAVINRQVPTDWDIFVGIMWARFGTPTGRAGSGTEEEFERALTRHREPAQTISILFYFKDAPISPSKLDTDQLRRVQAFRQHLQSHGLLTWDFTEADQFEKLLSLHLTRQVQDWRKRRGRIATAETIAHTSQEALALPEAKPTVELPPPLDDSGYLDLVEEFTERSNEMSDIVRRLSAAQEVLTEQSTKGREELDALREDPSTLSAKKVRASIARVADEMLNFTEKVESELPKFRAAVDASIVSLTKLATVSADLYPEKIEETKSASVMLLTVLIAARQSTEGFRDSTAGLPRMTKELNVAKRKQVAALNSLIAEFMNGEQLLTEGLTVIEGLGARGGESSPGESHP
jgi:hypothetical protein